MVDKKVIIKIITLIIAIILFIYACLGAESESKRLLLRAWGALDLQSNIVFGGFAIIYIGYGIGLITKEEPDEDLNALWAFFGFGAHVGLAYLFSDLGRKSKDYGNDDSDWSVIGFISACQAVMLFFDGWVAAGGSICGK